MLRPILYLVGLFVVLHLPAAAQTQAGKAEILKNLDVARIDAEGAAQLAADSERISKNIATFSNFVLKSDKEAPPAFKEANAEATALVGSARSQTKVARALAAEIETAKEKVIVADDKAALDDMRSSAVALSKRAKDLAASAASTTASATALNSKLAREPVPEASLQVRTHRASARRTTSGA